MTTPRSPLTILILQQDPELDNRQVADLLQVDIELVKKARRYHGVTHKITPRNRGCEEMIRQYSVDIDAKEVAAKVGCSKQYVQEIRRRMRSA